MSDLLLAAGAHVRTAFGSQGRRVEVLDAYRGVLLVEGQRREYFAYPSPVALQTIGAQERWLKGLVVRFSTKTLTRSEIQKARSPRCAPAGG